MKQRELQNRENSSDQQNVNMNKQVTQNELFSKMLYFPSEQQQYLKQTSKNNACDASHYIAELFEIWSYIRNQWTEFSSRLGTNVKCL